VRSSVFSFTTIDFPGATFTFAGAINPKGDIVGEYNDTAGVGHAFLLSNSVFTSFDFPGAIFTDASGINPGVSSLVSILTQRALSTDLSGRRK
jgi:probable HAF family extracellular repeat protein